MPACHRNYVSTKTLDFTLCSAFNKYLLHNDCAWHYDGCWWKKHEGAWGWSIFSDFLFLLESFSSSHSEHHLQILCCSEEFPMVIPATSDSDRKKLFIFFFLSFFFLSGGARGCFLRPRSFGRFLATWTTFRSGTIIIVFIKVPET